MKSLIREYLLTSINVKFGIFIPPLYVVFKKLDGCLCAKLDIEYFIVQM